MASFTGPGWPPRGSCLCTGGTALTCPRAWESPLPRPHMAQCSPYPALALYARRFTCTAGVLRLRRRQQHLESLQLLRRAGGEPSMHMRPCLQGVLARMVTSMLRDWRDMPGLAYKPARQGRQSMGAQERRVPLSDTTCPLHLLGSVMARSHPLPVLDWVHERVLQLPKPQRWPAVCMQGPCVLHAVPPPPPFRPCHTSSQLAAAGGAAASLWTLAWPPSAASQLGGGACRPRKPESSCRVSCRGWRSPAAAGPGQGPCVPALSIQGSRVQMDGRAALVQTKRLGHPCPVVRLVLEGLAGIGIACWRAPPMPAHA